MSWDEIIKGTNGSDVINGGSGDDFIQGRAGGDFLDGGDGDDQIQGNEGDDYIRGGAGNDFLHGGTGTDTAAYSGSVKDYSFSRKGDEFFINHVGGSLIDGNDRLISIERLVFADAAIDLTQNNAPIAFADVASTDEDHSVSGNVLANDFDWEGNSLTATPGVFNGVYGTLTLNSNGTYTYTPYASTQALALGQTVSESFTYSVSDGSLSGSGTLTVAVSGRNDAPVANPDSASAGENSPVSVNVLANDTDVDNGAVLTVIAASAPAGQGSASVVANQVVFNPGTDFDHLDTGETATVVVSYTITDQHGATSSSTVTITVNGANDAPVANDDSASTGEDSSVSGNVLANDTDVDGEPLTVANPGVYAGAYGTLTLNADGSFTYVPGAAAQGLDDGETAQDVFTYSASDGTASDPATLTITLNGSNDAPVANDDGASTSEDSSVSGNVLANDSDPDGEPLTVTNPGVYVGAYGTLTLNSDGSYTYAPGAAAQGLDSGETAQDVFAYAASDGTASDGATLTITVNGANDAPTANDDVASASEDGSASGNVLANDTDVDGEALTVANPGTYVGNFGTLSLAADGSYTYTPNAAAQGLDDGETAQDVFTYSATDGTASDPATLTVTVSGANDAPVANDDAAVTDEDNPVSGNVLSNDTDVDGEALTVTNPGTYTGTYGTLTLAADGSYTYTPNALAQDLDLGDSVQDVFTYTASDGTVSDTATLTVTVNGADDGPQTVWYIDNSAVGSTNEGTQANPFTSIAAFNAAQGTVDGPQDGATVYLLQGTGTYAEADGINLLDGQILIGVGQPVIAPLAGNGIDLADDNNVSGVDIAVSAGNVGIEDDGSSVGNLVISDVGISGAGQIVDLDTGGTLDVTLNSAASTGSSGGAIDLAGVGGSFTVTGATTIAGVHSGGGIDITGSSVAATFAGGGAVATGADTAVNYVGNSGSLALGGGFDILTTGGAGLNASGGGTVTVTGASNSIASTTGTALSVSNTAIGAAGLTFESISSNGAANGIVLNNTGTVAGVNGGLTVTGDGGSAANGSGGTIAGSTGAGISLAGTRDVSLDQVVVQDGLDDGVRGDNVTNFALTNSAVVNNGNALGEHGADFTNLLGDVAFEDVLFSNNEASQVSILNTSGTATIVFDDVTASSAGLASGPNGQHGLILQTAGSANVDLAVLNSNFDNLFSNSIQATNSGSGTLEISIAETDFTNIGASAISIAQASSGAVRFYIHDNDTFLRGTNSGASHSININQASTAPAGAVLEGAIVDNVIGNSSSSTSATAGGDGIRVFSVGAGTTNVLIDGNDIQGVGGNGINVQMSGSANPAHKVNATISDNLVVLTDANSGDGIRVVAGANTGNAGILRLDMHDNDSSTANPFANDFTVRQRFATTVELLDYSGSPTDVSAVQAYLDSRGNDPLGAGNDWFITTQAPGGGFVHASTVPQPILPTPEWFA